MPEYRVEVCYINPADDAAAREVLSAIREDLCIRGIASLNCVDVYLVDADFSDEEIRMVAERLMHDPLTQKFSINKPLFGEFGWEIEVRLHPNVTDNTGIAARTGISDLLGRKLLETETVSAARKYVICGELKERDVKRICTALLANPLIESWKTRKGRGKIGAGRRQGLGGKLGAENQKRAEKTGASE